ncbi:MAG: glycoside hydrolase family 2 TIM barrel-domain containing protein [Proteiniphilum sp.]|uniref:glycoside hydrolase family 2 protein n=1 Tax=Proteiniphilum sp. TaxID=1926877 RepID=UPI002B20019A|nr:sugar-binding domain-containing protein [Proteiniphilum sp.]MEA5127532.1 glycoside hydrolase family 2 TIM barrel-domain containing protein [Proteiniphilum sp.]
MKKRVEFYLVLLIICIYHFEVIADNISLNGSWELTYFPQPREAVRTPDDLQKIKGSTIKAMVPGNVELDMLAAGIIEDPMIGNNVYSLRKYEGYQWCYSKKFPTPEVKEDEYVKIFFGGIDCFADIWLNDQLVGSVDNMLIEHEFDITKYLKKGGENDLQVIIRSSVLEAQKYFLGTFSIGNFANEESVYVRRAPHTYGWDIMPRLVSAGLWRNVELRIINHTNIIDAHWMTANIDLEDKKALVYLDLQTEIPFDQLDNCRGIVTLNRKGREVYKADFDIVKHAFRLNINLDEVDFWWPKGYGDPALYDAEVKLVSKTGKILSTHSSRIGIRTTSLDLKDINHFPDDPGRFCFIVNGEPLFIKGTNWVPLDALHSRDASLLEDALNLVVEMNCNMIRCWGGSVYEDSRFFELCDENGIMVWQDFAMGCTFYPQRRDFADAIEKEAISVVRKFRNHPSLILWSGNNENDVALRWGMIHYNINPNEDIITRIILPRVIYEMDPTRNFLPSSPYYSQAVYDEGSHDDLLPENHLWGPRGYYKDPFYTESKAQFVSEIGYHGCPNRQSLEKMFTKECVNPWLNGKVGLWNDEWMTKAVRIYHQSPKQGGRNDLMTNQVKLLFGSVPENLDDFIMASQVVQAEAMKFFVEMWRGDKPNRSGIIWWNIRDGWPVLSDAIVDYYNSKKLAFHFLKTVHEDVCVFINDAKEGAHTLVVTNDTRKPSKGDVVISDVMTGKEIYKGTFDSKANGRLQIAELPKMKGQGILLIRYTVDGKELSNHYLYGEPPFNLNDYKTWLEKTDIYDI